jgi:ParE toxin of type II toxin-antitoxin system, parDE
MEKENSRYTVIVSEKAVEMLLAHVRFLVNVSEEAAQHLVSDFNYAAKSLETFPDRNTWLSDPTLPINKYRKMMFGKRYLIIYQIKTDKMYLDFVVDCRQDYAWLL